MTNKTKTINEDRQLSRFWREDRRGERYLDTAAVRHTVLAFGPLSVAGLLLVVSLISLLSALTGRGADERYVAEAIVERNAEAYAAEQEFQDSYRNGLEEFSGAAADRMDADIAAAHQQMIEKISADDVPEFSGTGELEFVWDHWSLLSHDDGEYRYFALAEVLEADAAQEVEELVVGISPGQERPGAPADVARAWIAVEITSETAGSPSEINMHWADEPVSSWSGENGDAAEDTDDEGPGL